MTVTHASLSEDDVIGLHLGTAPLGHGHFEAAIVADVNMKRCLGEVVMLVKFLGQASGVRNGEDLYSFRNSCSA